MSTRGRRMGADALALQESPETRSADAAKTMPEWSIVVESVNIDATASPTEGEIATVAYELWLDKGCPVGLDQEDWFRAEAILTNAPAAKCECLLRGPSVARGDTRTEFGMLVEFRWKGHWEAWEMEWGCARWICD